MGNKWLTTKEAAESLGITTGRVLQLYWSGELEGEKTGRDVLINPQSVEAAKARKTKPGPAPQSPVESAKKSRKQS